MSQEERIDKQNKIILEQDEVLKELIECLGQLQSGTAVSVVDERVTQIMRVVSII